MKNRVVTSTERAQALADRVSARCLGSRITRLHRVVALRYDTALAAVGLTLPQVEILSTLVMWGRPARPSELGQDLAVGRSAMSRKLAALEARGWVETVQRSQTGRSMSFGITAAGTAALGRADDAWAAVQRDTERRLGSDALRRLDTWLVDLQDPPQDHR